jgi:hypothetical protein
VILFKSEALLKTLISLSFWVCLCLVAGTFFTTMAIALLDALYNEMRYSLDYLGLRGWPLAVIPLSCGVVAGWLAWRHLRGSQRIGALTLCLIWSGIIGLHAIAPDYAYQHGL